MERRAVINRKLSVGVVRGDLLPELAQISASGWSALPQSVPVPSSLDLLISFFELHLIDDVAGELARCRASLAPDGVFLACLFGGRTLVELRQSLLAAESQITGSAAARVIPFVEVRTLGTLVGKAGFALPVIDVDTVTVRYSSLRALLRDIRNMGEGNPLFAPVRPLCNAVLTRAEELYRQDFGDENGLLPARFDILHICGWAPHESQQQPLAPGSGQMFLGDALKKS